MTQRVATAGFLVLAIASSVPVTAFGSDNPDGSAPLSPAEWHKAMLKTPPDRKGCFEVVQPNKSWQEVPCAPAVDRAPIGVPPTMPAASAPGLSAMAETAAPGPLSMGGGGEGFLVSVAYADDAFALVEGTFPQALGVQSDSNWYSLQLNANNFIPEACKGAADPASCSGWQQFTYQNYDDHGDVIIWYFLNHWGKTCDASQGWTPYGDDGCLAATPAATVPPQQISNLSNLGVTGIAGSYMDTVYFYYLDSGVGKIKANSNDSLLGLRQKWKFAEFNIFGVAWGAPVIFKPGASIVVAMDAWAYPPSGNSHRTMCVSGPSQTGETNNLNLFGNCCFDTYRYWFFESNTDSTNRPACPLNATGSSCGGNDNCLSGICSNGICSPPPPRPTKQASSLVFTPPYESPPGHIGMTVGWQNGDGEATAVFVAALTTTTSDRPLPLDGAIYLQNVNSPSNQGSQFSSFGQGSQIGTTGWSCVYNGTATYVNVSGLQYGTAYAVMAVTYNGYSLGNPIYLTSMAINNPRYYPPGMVNGVPATPAAAVAALAVILCVTGLMRVSSRKRGRHDSHA